MLDANLIAYLTFTSVLAITPGSTTAVVVRNTLRGGRGAGLACAAGAAVANCVHAVVAGLGLSVLLTHWPIALVTVRVAGAVYLAGLGVQSLWTAFRSADGGLSFEARTVRRGDPSTFAEGLPPRTERRGFREGLVMNLANATIISFYVAIVPSFMPAGASQLYFVVLAGSHVTIALACHSMWALTFHGVRRWFAAPAARRALAAATGVALILLAVRVLS